MNKLIKKISLIYAKKYFLLKQFFQSATLSNYSLACQPVDHSNEELPLRVKLTF